MMDRMNTELNDECILDEDCFEVELGPNEWLAQIENELEEQGHGRLVRKLRLCDIVLCKPLFQPREGIDAGHVGKLQAALRGAEEGFDPLTVLPVGKTYYLVDGYHRYEAYLAEGWAAKVPVLCAMVDAQEAQRLSMQSNSQDKLPLTNDEKQNCAWRLVVAKNGSKAQQCKASGISDGQVAMMRRAAKALGERASWYDVWWQAREAWACIRSGEEQVEEEVFEDRARQKAERWARDMRKGIPPHATEDMTAFAGAIRLLTGHRLPALLEEIDLSGLGFRLIPYDEPAPDF